MARRWLLSSGAAASITLLRSSVVPASLRVCSSAGSVILAWGCGTPVSGPGETDSGPPQTGTDTDAEPPSNRASNVCETAPVVGVGRWMGTLRGHSSNLGGACGNGGPDAFLRLDIPLRADLRVQGQGVGFTPRIGVMPMGCTDVWKDSILTCTEALPGWVTDLAAGSSVIVSVGIDPESAALASPVPTDEPDPLDFVVDLALRRVLDVGDQCHPPSRGRCVVGTACLLDEQRTHRCTELAGDTCSAALDLAVDESSTVVTLDPREPQTDAHWHTCTGGRARERVFRLILPSEVEPTAFLSIHTDASGVGLAVRGSDCAPASELGCVAPTETGVALEIRGIAELAAAGFRPFLFVEIAEPMDDSAGRAPPVDVVLTVVPG